MDLDRHEQNIADLLYYFHVFKLVKVLLLILTIRINMEKHLTDLEKH